MLWIISILFGIAIGQHLRITPSPELSAAIAKYWPPIEEKAIATAKTAVTSAAKSIQSAAAKTKASNKTAPIQIFEITERGEQAL